MVRNIMDKISHFQFFFLFSIHKNGCTDRQTDGQIDNVTKTIYYAPHALVPLKGPRTEGAHKIFHVSLIASFNIPDIVQRSIKYIITHRAG